MFKFFHNKKKTTTLTPHLSITEVFQIISFSKQIEVCQKLIMPMLVENHAKPLSPALPLNRALGWFSPRPASPELESYKLLPRVAFPGFGDIWVCTLLPPPPCQPRAFFWHSLGLWPASSEEVTPGSQRGSSSEVFWKPTVHHFPLWQYGKLLAQLFCLQQRQVTMKMCWHAYFLCLSEAYWSTIYIL